MAVTIKTIRNLTLKDDLAPAEAAKFSNQTAYSETISGEAEIPDTWKPAHNIQVLWSEGNKVVTRAISGTLAKEAKKVTISELVDVSKYSFGINGQLAIGPKTKPEAVLLSVRVGNLPSVQNPKADWIIDFSDNEDGAPGTSIKLNELVDWIKDKSDDADAAVEFPEKEGEAEDKQPKNFEIEFKKFYYNITQNTFDFNVESKDGNEMTFGKFTIKKVGFRVTNAPLAVKTEEEGVKILPNAVKKIA